MKKYLLLIPLICILVAGCISLPSKTVLYQMQLPMTSFTYQWQGAGIDDQPLTYKEWLDIIGYGGEDEASEVEEKEL